ncbi:MAG: GatB/YqeY domain-containing protein [Helicobacteraceae bacterium]|nr:GatB/YqeY domain-containing protein [Helicobacteraceae bacterium]
MSLLKRIRDDIKTAMREHNAFLRDTLRNVNGALKQVEIDERRELSDVDVERILQKQIKQRQDSVEQYRLGKREDLVDKENKEIAIIEGYLPKQLSDQELEAALKEIIARLDQKTIGAVMAEAKKIIGAKADGRRISAKAKELIG